MKVFRLMRHKDVSGVSGTGIVAEGIVFGNGMVAMSWVSKLTSVAVYPDLDTVEKIHGHEGNTVVMLARGEF